MKLYQENDLQDAEYWVCKSIKDVVTEKMQERKMSLYELHKLSGVAHCYCAKAMNGEVINIYHLARIFKVLVNTMNLRLYMWPSGHGLVILSLLLQLRTAF